jgi:polysaccharide biosynthesis transport protein
MNTAQTLPINSINLAPEPDLGYGQLFAVLLRRRWWIIGAMVLAMAAGVGVTLRQKPLYFSTMQFLIESNYRGRPSASSPENQFSDSKVEVDTATQLALMQSSKLLQQAMQELQPTYPELNPNDPREVEKFRKSLGIIQVASKDKTAVATKIFQITYTDLDPYKAQRVLKGVQKVYQDYNRDQQRLRLENGLGFVTKKLPDIEKAVRQAEQRLENFRSDQNLIDPELQAKAKLETLIRINQEQQTGRTQLQELQSRFNSLQQRVGVSPADATLVARLNQSARYQSILNEIQKTELILAQQQLRFKPGTPEIDQILDQRQKQLGLLQTEVSRVIGLVPSGSSESLLGTGQLGGLDISLINQMVETQVTLQTAGARYQQLAIEEQALRNELQRFPKLLAEYSRLQPAIDLNRTTLKELLKAQQDIGLDIARGGFDWQVVEDPQMGLSKGVDWEKNLLLGAVAGLMLGGMAAFAREAADDAVHNSEELGKQVAVPLLGLVPKLQLLRGLPLAQGSLLPDMQEVLRWQPFRDAIDLLYQNIQLLGGPHPLRSLVITSALAGEGKSTLALGLAVSAARLHKRVLLIDGDLRRPSLHKLLNLPNEQGLSTLLTSTGPIPDLTGAGQDRSNVAILTAGPSPSDPAKLLSSPRMREVLAGFEQHYDLILFDAPPVLGMVDALLAASCCSGTLLVGRLDQLTRSELAQATNNLKQLNVIGIVANGTANLAGPSE